MNGEITKNNLGDCIEMWMEDAQYALNNGSKTLWIQLEEAEELRTAAKEFGDANDLILIDRRCKMLQDAIRKQNS